MKGMRSAHISSKRVALRQQMKANKLRKICRYIDKLYQNSSETKKNIVPHISFWHYEDCE